MAGAKEIRTKIRSVQSTQKITRAMEMVAASKMRKSQNRMKASKPYAEKISKVINHLSKANPEYHHAYLAERTPKVIGYIVVATDRGLCGGLNINLFRALVKDIKSWQDKGVKVKLCVIGSKALSFFNRVGADIVATTTNLGESPSVDDLIGAVKVMLDSFNNNEIDNLFLAYNDFVNTMTQKPTITKLLPVAEDKSTEKADYWDYIYEPDAKELLDQLMVRYIESLVYQGVVDNIACEQAARMIAMKSASDNAAEIIDELKLVYNKARQASITQELSEIVAGAQAV